MCGRFTLRTSPQKLLEDFGVSFPEFTPRYNIAPTQLVFALRAGLDGDGRHAAALRGEKTEEKTVSGTVY